MTTAVRHHTLTNTVAALIPSGSPAIICNTGQDYGFETIKRTIVTAEIGTAAGQTRDTASNPTTGFLFAQFQGANIRQIISVALVKNVTATHTTVFDSWAWGVAGVSPFIYDLCTRFVNTTDAATTPGWDPNFSSIFLLDKGDDATSQIVNGDRIVMVVELGGIS